MPEFSTAHEHEAQCRPERSVTLPSFFQSYFPGIWRYQSSGNGHGLSSCRIKRGMILHGSKKKVNISHNGFSFLTCADRVITKLENEPWSGAREPTGERETRFPGVLFKSHAHARGTRDADESRHFLSAPPNPQPLPLPTTPKRSPRGSQQHISGSPRALRWILYFDHLHGGSRPICTVLTGL